MTESSGMTGGSTVKAFVAKRWIERAYTAIELWKAHTPSPRLASEVLIVWMGLHRLRHCGEREEKRRVVQDTLDKLVEEKGVPLLMLACCSFGGNDAWQRGLLAHKAGLGNPPDEVDITSARNLIEDLDSVMLVRFAFKKIGREMPERNSAMVQQCLDLAMEHKDCLRIADVFIYGCLEAMDQNTELFEALR